MRYLVTLWAGLIALFWALFFPLVTLVVGAIGLGIALFVDTSRAEVDYGRIVLFVVHCAVVVLSLLVLAIHYILSFF